MDLPVAGVCVGHGGRQGCLERSAQLDAGRCCRLHKCVNRKGVHTGGALRLARSRTVRIQKQLLFLARVPRRLTSGAALPWSHHFRNRLKPRSWGAYLVARAARRSTAHVVALPVNSSSLETSWLVLTMSMFQRPHSMRSRPPSSERSRPLILPAVVDLFFLRAGGSPVVSNSCFGALASIMALQLTCVVLALGFTCCMLLFRTLAMSMFTVFCASSP